MGTKNEGDRCYDAALDDEPMFVLLARDPSAPALVRQWAAIRRVDIEAGTRPESDRAQVEEAERLADRMKTWRVEADEAWRKQPSLFDGPLSTMGADVHDDFERFPNEHDPLAGQHLARREGDEYICSRCGKRWDVSDDAPEQCA
jgi:hypothetical protein